MKLRDGIRYQAFRVLCHNQPFYDFSRHGWLDGRRDAQTVTSRYINS